MGKKAKERCMCIFVYIHQIHLHRLPLTTLASSFVSAAAHAGKLQQLRNDLERTRYMPLGQRALGRVSDGSREEVLRA